MKYICIFFIIIQIFFNSNFYAQALEKNPMLKIGLFYGTTSLKTVNFENQIGFGYNIGLFEKNKFIPLFLINEKKIIIKNLLNSDKSKNFFHIELTKDFITENDINEFQNDMTIKGINSFIRFSNGQYKLRLSEYQSNINFDYDKLNLLKIFAENEIKIVKSNDITLIFNNKNEKILFEISNSEIYIAPIANYDKKSTWLKGFAYSGDFICIKNNFGNFIIINYIDMQNYLKGVVPYEMNPLWHIEALKAQAICARSYAYNNKNKHKKYGFDLCNSIDCQVYNGYKFFNNSNDAVEKTSGMFIMYNNNVATGFFHSSNGGATEDSENVWNIYIPYLRGVIDNNENISKIKNGSWQVKLSKQIISDIIISKGYQVKKLNDIYIDKYTKLGNVLRLIIIADNKKIIFEREKVRTILNSIKYNISINSMRYNLEKIIIKNDSNDSNILYYINDNQILKTFENLYVIGKNSQINILDLSLEKYIICEGNKINNLQNDKNDNLYMITGHGWGHNVGMSQYGAKALAEKGVKCNDIIKFYFTDIYISK